LRPVLSPVDHAGERAAKYLGDVSRRDPCFATAHLCRAYTAALRPKDDGVQWPLRVRGISWASAPQAVPRVIRRSAKHHADLVSAVFRADRRGRDYPAVLLELAAGLVSERVRLRLAGR